MAINIVPGAVCINVSPNAVGYIVLKDDDDPNGGRLDGRNVLGGTLSDDNPTGKKITWKATIVPQKKPNPRLLIIKLTRPDNNQARAADDGSCPDSGNITITLDGSNPPPVSPVTATYTTDGSMAGQKTR
ncbi:MAG TPA: hypothetical protein VGZ47_14600 [Gemmataceae bacterium]|jgi:hypothetical protein|nr:hypothetical protein [Gemmataceae bacterium]